MKVIQYTWPFPGRSFSIEIGNKNAVQIGIEHPQSVPITEVSDERVILSLASGAEEYAISDRDILEFSNLQRGKTDLEVILKEAAYLDPYLIIDVAYE